MSNLLRATSMCIVALTYCVAIGLASLVHDVDVAMRDDARRRALIEQSGVTDHVHDRLLPVLIGQLTAKGMAIGGHDHALRVELGPQRDEAIHEALDHIAPTERFVSLASANLGEAYAYTSGNRDQATFDIGLGSRAADVRAGLNHFVERADVASRVLEDGLVPYAQGGADALMVRSLGISVGPEEVAELVHATFPPSWVEAELQACIERLSPYLTGELAEFRCRVDVRSRVLALGDALEERIHEDKAQELLLDRLTDPYLAEGALDDEARAIGLTEDDVMASLEESLTPAWAKRKATHGLSLVVDYTLGRRDDLTFRFDVASRKEAFAAALERRARDAVTRTLQELPTCDFLQVAGATRDLLGGELPACTPTRAEALASRVRDAVGERVRSRVMAQDSMMVLDDETVREHLGKTTIDLLDSIRIRIERGVVVDDELLEKSIATHGGPSASLVLEGLRGEPIAWPTAGTEPLPGALRSALGAEWLLWLVAAISLVAFGGLSRPSSSTQAPLAPVARALFLGGGAAAAWGVFGLVGGVSVPGIAAFAESVESQAWIAALTDPTYQARWDAFVETQFHRWGRGHALVAGVSLAGAFVLRGKAKPDESAGS